MRMRRVLQTLLFLLSFLTLHAATLEEGDTLSASPDKMRMSDVRRDTTLTRKEKLKGYGNIFTRFLRAFDEIDTTYITPNYYNWAFMLQNTTTYELYSLNSPEEKQSIRFSPKPSIKLGPYLGWRWIFLGYTFDVSSLGEGHKSQRTEFELSLYSSMLGCDLIYRRTGDDFRIHKVKGFGDDAKEVEGHYCNGIRLSVTGANLYYIFNHKRFSYPAAFAQSTVQRKSCGTWKVGFSITRHLMQFNYDELPEQLKQNPSYPLSQSFMFREINYMDYSVSGGYAYNWVFKKNWLFCISVSPAIGYKKTTSNTTLLEELDEKDSQKRSRIFNMNNFNFNTTLRAGLVWNNTKYFGGLSIIMHNYNYHHSRLSINNTFGTLNLYMGLNFRKRKQYR